MGRPGGAGTIALAGSIIDVRFLVSVFLLSLLKRSLSPFFIGACFKSFDFYPLLFCVPSCSVAPVATGLASIYHICVSSISVVTR